jgi:hypothetical protein
MTGSPQRKYDPEKLDAVAAADALEETKEDD